MSKLEELKEKFEGFVEDLKSKLPLKKGSKADEYEEDEDEDEFEENTSRVNVNPEDLDEATDSQTLTEVGTTEEDEEDEEEEEDEVEKKTKQKTWLIRGVIIILVGVLAFDFLMPTDDNAVPEVPVVKKQKRIRAKRKRNIPDTTAGVGDTTIVAQAAVEPIPEPTPEPIPEPIVPVEAVPKESEVAIPPETPNEPMEIEVENSLNIGENSTNGKPSLTMDEQVDKILKKGQDKASQEGMALNEEIDPKMEYVTPPNYKRLGRGLVYNCIGKHWACVDKFSFFQCLENSKWSTANKKDPECKTNNVYATDADCAVVQTHYINTRAATDFCDSQGSKDTITPSTKVVVP